MKKLFLSALAALLTLGARADGGMWFLQLMEEQHLADSLRAAGLQMKPKQLLALRDCVGQFGGGCTAEVISPDGLILTNNHCGYSYVHAMSTLETNYLQDGYFAKSRVEELPVPELTFSFVISVAEVTALVEDAAARSGTDEYVRQTHRFLQPLADSLLALSSYKGQAGMEAEVVPFYGGNRFYIFYTQTYPDVRLVVNPPLNVAQFGGDGDNWVWPRHNPDFAVFRVYADAKGRPAAYDPANVPLRRKHYLPISLRGYEEGDYTMIMGFPGRTSRYLSAAQLEREMQAIYTPINAVGVPLLEWEREQMERSDSVRLAMQDDHMMLQNTVKNFGGALEAVRRTGLVEQKRVQDEALTQYALRKGDAELAGVVDKIGRLLNTAMLDTIHDFMLYRRTLSLDSARRAVTLPLWEKLCRLPSSKAVTAATSKEEADSVMRTYYAAYARTTKAEVVLSRTYQRGIMDMNGWSTAPDANFTQRLTYGHVRGYSPRDAVRYDFKTQLGGMFEKESVTDPDYAVNPRVRQLYVARDFGRYATSDGLMQTDFLTDNDITGGNSGSPVLNARGELIGVAFDGNIESLSSDFKYNPQLQRCINADIRYVLWTIDTFGGSGYLLRELELRP
ncbi:MAG: S46 family peptidase [Alloprevotella sp.]|nr:S46 family peptidase [Alloprevotella sp.]